METVNFPSINSSQMCDLCKSGARIFYCHDHLAYFCILCDQRIHSTGSAGPQQHERVWVCNCCEEEPADLICEADAAFLCKRCDDEIHSANTLAQRHVRVLVMSVPCIAPDEDEQPDPMFNFGTGFLAPQACKEMNEDETGSWLLLDPSIPDETVCPEYQPQDHSDYLDNTSNIKETRQQQDELVKDAFIGNLSSQQTVPDSVMGILQKQARITARNSYAMPPSGGELPDLLGRLTSNSIPDGSNEPGSESVEVQREEESEEVREESPLCIKEGLCREPASSQRPVHK